jgi:hypothetical protein
VQPALQLERGALETRSTGFQLRCPPTSVPRLKGKPALPADCDRLESVRTHVPTSARMRTRIILASEPAVLAGLRSDTLQARSGAKGALTFVRPGQQPVARRGFIAIVGVSESAFESRRALTTCTTNPLQHELCPCPLGNGPENLSQLSSLLPVSSAQQPLDSHGRVLLLVALAHRGTATPASSGCIHAGFVSALTLDGSHGPALSARMRATACSCQVLTSVASASLCWCGLPHQLMTASLSAFV